MERKTGIDAQKFFDYYESKGWIIGKAPMKDWKRPHAPASRRSQT